MKTLLFVVLVLVVTRGYCSPCTLTESVNITEGWVYPNGSIFLLGIEFISGRWYELEVEGQTTRYGCPCIERTCLFKCCKPEQAYYNRTCNDMEVTVPFNPPLFKGKEPSTLLANETFFYMYGQSCAESYLVDSAVNNEELYIQENGTLLEVALGSSQWHDPMRYCVEVMNADTLQPWLVAGVCYSDIESTDDSYLLYAAYAVGLLLSLPFLLATFLVYALIPELRNLHGMCLMAYCGGLIVAFPSLAYLKLHVGQIGVSMTGCYTVAFIVYYAFQTSFFWLNIMCFDIWRTFRSGYRGGGSSKRRENRRFAMYAVYAWGIPSLLTGVTVAMQFSDVGQGFVTPGFGSKRCWFVDWLSELVYFFGPVLVLVVCNITFFSITAYRIRSIKQETAILKGAESSRSDKLKKDKQRYALYLKLFMVMGVNWSAELISFAVGGSNWYWVVVDISNVTLGFVIFFIFVWKKKVRALVQNRFRYMFGLEAPSADSRGGRWTSNSAPTEDTRVSGDESAMRLKDLH